MMAAKGDRKSAPIANCSMEITGVKNDRIIVRNYMNEHFNPNKTWENFPMPIFFATRQFIRWHPSNISRSHKNDGMHR